MKPPSTYYFTLTFLSKVLAQQVNVKAAYVGSSIWAIFFGMILANVIFRNGIPVWLKVAQQTELYIATSLVLLLIDFSELKPLATRALLVSWIDTPVLFVLMSYVGHRVFGLAMPQSLIMSACALVCGSSAAMAIAAAMSLKKDQTDMTIAISSIMTVPAIVFLPRLAIGWDLSERAAGAWFGGCVDSTGAVVASANVFGGQETLAAASVIKMTQNCIIAPIAVGVTALVVRFPHFINPESPSTALLANTSLEVTHSLSLRESLGLMWARFPKFVLGFVAMAVVFNTVIPAKDRSVCRNFAFFISEWYSTLSQVSIGMSMNIWLLAAKISTTMRLFAFYLLVQLLDVIATYGFARAAFE